MADISDIENALVAAIGNTLIGSGFEAMAAANSVVTVGGSPVMARVYRGEPISDGLATDLKAGICHVTIFPEPGMTRLGARLITRPRPTTQVTTTLTAVSTANTVTFGGSASAGVLAGIGWDHTGWALRFDNPANSTVVAQSFATLIPNATVSGSTVTLPTSLDVFANVVGDTITTEEVRRQHQCFKVTIWAPNPRVRDAIGAKVSGFMGSLRSMPITTQDFTGPPVFRGVWVEDHTQKVGTWVRRERYEIEYSTVFTEQVPGILFAGLNTNVGVQIGQFHPDGPIVLD